MYCLDTSALIVPWTRWYRPDRFPTFWQRLEQEVRGGQVVACEEVLAELAKQDDDLAAWAKAQPGLIAPLSSGQISAVREIMAEYPRLVDNRRERSVADPFVIALAQELELKVVTNENGGTTKKPKIPSVCRDLGLPCIGIPDFIDELGWTF